MPKSGKPDFGRRRGRERRHRASFQEAIPLSARVKNKGAVITTAGQGIGRAIAERFIAEGALVIASDLDAGKLKGLAAKKCVKLDVRSTPEVEALAQAVVRDFGAPHILVNCAGWVHDGTILQCSEQDWDFSLHLNVKAV